MFPAREEVGDHGEGIQGPPWILGHRGSPLEAPENTLVSLRRAIDLGLDGVEYDLRSTAGDEIVLMHDETIDRTTDGHGVLAEKSIVELASLDAGGWFEARFRSERVPLFEEALDLAGDPDRGSVQHMIELKERGLVPDVARAVRELAPKSSVRVASFLRDVCLEARDEGLVPMLLADEASEKDREFVREERIAAYGTGPGGWRTEAGQAEWRCERWSWSVDEPEDLLDACRLRLNGFNTNEPLRALATRALVHLAPHDDGPYPVQTPALEVSPGELTGGRGDWCGVWESAARVRNPFPFATRVACGILPRRGAFEIGKVPVALQLAPGEEALVPFTLTGGSWRPGGDPSFFASFRWRRGPGRPAGRLGGRLLLDAPLHRVRTTVADVIARRLKMLREAPGDAEASMTLRRHRNWLLVSIENSGGLQEARTVLHLDGRFIYGGRGVRAALPADFDRRRQGIAFSCGFIARRAGELIVRRWAGGVPDELGAGVPGRLLSLQHA